MEFEFSKIQILEMAQTQALLELRILDMQAGTIIILMVIFLTQGLLKGLQFIAEQLILCLPHQ
jgi:hypothetical protein